MNVSIHRSTTQWVIKNANTGAIVKTFPIATKSQSELQDWIQRNGMMEVR